MRLQDLTQPLMLYIERKILSEVSPDSKIMLLVAYGSRVTGEARENSDYDLCCVVDKGPKAGPWSMEFHGQIEAQGQQRSLELRIYTLDALEREISGGPALKSRAVVASKALHDEQGLHSALLMAARNRIDREVGNILNEISSLKSSELINLFRVVYTQAREILTDEKSRGNSVAVQARLMEYILDFYIYVQYLCYLRNPVDFDKRALENIVYLKGSRPARMINENKAYVQPWFSRFCAKAGQILDNGGLSQTDKVFKIFDELNATFRPISGQDLFLKPAEKCEAVFL